MARVTQSEGGGDERIVLGLLTSLETNGSPSQRHLAAELGIALGLVNAYLKRCVKKGLVKVGDAPARRYAYYLTPQGFAEKSRLTVNYLSASFGFFRQAKADCTKVFDVAKSRGFRTLVLAGTSDIAEVAILCAVESGVAIVAVIDPAATTQQFAGIKVFPTFSAFGSGFDAVVVTQLVRAREVLEAATALYGPDRVLAPAMLGLGRAMNAEGAT